MQHGIALPFIAYCLPIKFMYPEHLEFLVACLIDHLILKTNEYENLYQTMLPFNE
jgi:hypothetical protein